jgi:Domain of Unknown Function (DUF1080)
MTVVRTAGLLRGSGRQIAEYSALLAAFFISQFTPMKRSLLLSAAVAICSIALTAHADDPATPKGFRALFNGKDLTGWNGWNPHDLKNSKEDQNKDFANHWHVENGELVNGGKGPYANTNEELGDIELLIEYKTVPHADSGVYLRGCPQVQIWDKNQVFDPKKPDRKPHLGSGGLFNNTPNTPGRDPLVLADKEFGEWNQFRIIQIGARTWVWLNGKLTVDGNNMENYWDRAKPFPTKGPIMLQTHGGEIRWRNIFVHEISAEEGKKIIAEADAKKN